MPDKYPLPLGDPASLGFAGKPLQHLDRLIRQHLEEGRYPGAQIALARPTTCRNLPRVAKARSPCIRS